MKRISHGLALAAALLVAAFTAACDGKSSDQSALGSVTPTAVPISNHVAVATSDANPLVINLEVNDLGVSPSTFQAPVGRPVRLIVRNLGFREHDYRIVGLEPKDRVWFVLDENLESQLSNPNVTPVPTVSVLEDHSAHHHEGVWVPRHGTINVQSAPGRIGIVMFIPDSTGRFEFADPAAPDDAATLVVF